MNLAITYKRLTLGALSSVLLMMLLIAWRLSGPVQFDQDRWQDHSGPFTMLTGQGRGLSDLQALATKKKDEAWAFAMPGVTERQIRFPKALDLRGFKSMDLPLQLKGDRIGRVLVSIRVVHHNGWIYETWRQEFVDRGPEQVLKVDLTPHSPDFAPVGHGRPWDDESARAITRINLRLRSPRAFKGQLEIGRPKLTSENVVQANSQPFGRGLSSTTSRDTSERPSVSILDWEVTTRKGLLEATFRMDPTPSNPFDPEEYDSRLLLIERAASDFPALYDKSTRLSEKAWEAARPAFFDQSYIRDSFARKAAEELRPLGAPHFKIRIRLPESIQENSWDGIAILGVNRTIVGRIPIRIAPEESKEPSASGLDLTNSARSIHPPAWTRDGGEPFCRMYRPRIEWTGMPWNDEAAQFQTDQAQVIEGVPADQPTASATSSEEAPDKQSPWTYTTFPQQVMCWSPPLEWNEAWGKWQGLGRYDLELCWRFERILEKAGSENLCLPLLLIDDDMFFNQGKFRWPMNPLSSASGGPITGPGRFFANPDARVLLTRKLRYLAARFGTFKTFGDWILGSTLPASEVALWHQLVAKQADDLNRATGWFEDNKFDRSAQQIDLPTRNIVSLHPWATAFKQVTRRNSFEEGEQDHVYWKAEPRLSPGTQMQLEPDQASHGKQSAGLRLGNGFPGQVCLMRELLFERNEADNFYPYSFLIFDVYVPKTAPHDMRAVVHFRDRDELWYETLLDPLLRPGDWTRVIVDITARNAHRLTPVNHARPWDDYSRTRIREIGIRIFCQREYSGPVLIDNIHFAGNQVNRIEAKIVPRVTIRGEVPKQVAVFNKWEIDFDLNKSYPNPYDPEVVEVNAHITTPSGRTRTVPAFFYEPYERKLVKKKVFDTVQWRKIEREVLAEEIEPVRGGMAGFWKLRFAPEEQGAHQVTLEIREGGQWKGTRETWIPDDRFTREGEPLPWDRYHGQFTRIQDRQADGRRRVQWIKFTPGTIATRSPAIHFESTAGSNRGFVRRSEDHRYFETSDGSFFYPIGMNLATPSEQQLPFRSDDWTYLRLYEIGHRGTYQYDDYFEAFEKNGMNWAKIWMATWWTGLEWRRDWPPYQGVGRYSQPNAWRMDHLIESAKKKGIYLQVILMNHGQVSSGINHDWENCPYNSELGGPIKSAREFFSESEAKKLFKNKLRYISARWGYATSVLDWTLCGEMDFTEEYQTRSFDLYVPSRDQPAPETMVMWIDEMADYLRSIDPGRHLISTHLSHPQRGQNIQFAKGLDLVQSNAYSGFPWIADGGMNAVNAINAFYYGQEGVHHFKGMKQFGKPVLICEQGGHWHGISWKYGNHTENTQQSLDADLHAGLWSGMLSPLAGQTGYWWWLHVHFDNTYEHFKGATRFMEGEDLRGQDFVREEPAMRSNGQTLKSLAFHNGKRGFAWVYDWETPKRLTKRRFEDVQISLRVEKGTYGVEFWHTTRGEILEQTKITSSDEDPQDQDIDTKSHITFKLPVFYGDIAIKFKRQE